MIPRISGDSFTNPNKDRIQHPIKLVNGSPSLTTLVLTGLASYRPHLLQRSLPLSVSLSVCLSVSLSLPLSLPSLSLYLYLCLSLSPSLSLSLPLSPSLSLPLPLPLSLSLPLSPPLSLVSATDACTGMRHIWRERVDKADRFTSYLHIHSARHIPLI